MDIEHLEGRRYLVPSRSSEIPHLVDLDEPECSCRAWTCYHKQRNEMCYHMEQCVLFEQQNQEI